MKVLPFFICIFLSIQLLGQQQSAYPLITIKAKSTETQKVIQDIAQQAQLDHSFQSNVINANAKIDFEVEQRALEETLRLFCDKIGVDYTIVEETIVFIAAKEKEILLSGTVTDKNTGETLIGAIVMVKGSSRGTYTNEFGHYTLHLKSGKQTLICSYIGFEKIAISIELQKNSERNFQLSATQQELPIINVGLSSSDVLKDKQLDAIELSASQMDNMPEFAGESGLVKNLQSLPGIKIHSDASAFFYTRGGERDQNLIILDDAPVFNPSHFFGFFSMIVPAFAKSIKVYKSDIPVTMGDRLSSIVSIRTKDGNLNKSVVSGAIHPLMYRFSVELPVVKEKSNVFFSLRRTAFERLYGRTAPTANVRFQDFHFKWNYKINSKNRLYFTALQSGDFFENTIDGTRQGIRWGNFAATFRWNHLFGPKLFSNTTLYTGNYVYHLNVPPNSWKSELGMLSLKSDFTHYASAQYTAKFGFENQRYAIRPGALTLDPELSILPTVSRNSSQKTVLYYQGNWRFSKMSFKAGLRMTGWANSGPKTYYRFDENYEVSDTVHADIGVYSSFLNMSPRLSWQYQLDSTAYLKCSYGRYHQYLQIISNSISPFTSLEIWLPAGPHIRPQLANQWALNYFKFFKKAKMELSAATYYKIAKNQIDYAPHTSTFLNPFIEGILRFGTTRSFGFEFLLKKDFGRVNGWIGYTYARAFRQTDQLNEGKVYPAFQDRPHDFSMLLNFRFSPRFSGTAYWTIYSGATFTSPVGFYDFNGQRVPIFGERNNDRLPTYQRLDLGLKLILNKNPDSRYQHNLTLSLYNALGHKNVYAVRFNKLFSNSLNPKVPANVLLDERLSPSELDLIRFFPSLTYKFRI